MSKQVSFNVVFITCVKRNVNFSLSAMLCFLVLLLYLNKYNCVVFNLFIVIQIVIFKNSFNKLFTKFTRDPF